MQKNIQDVKKRCAGANGGVEEKNQGEQLNDMDDVKENKGDRKNNVRERVYVCGRCERTGGGEIHTEFVRRGKKERERDRQKKRVQSNPEGPSHTTKTHSHQVYTHTRTHPLEEILHHQHFTLSLPTLHTTRFVLL